MSIFLFNPNTNVATTAAMVEIASAEGVALVGRTAPFGVPMIVEPSALERSAEAVEAMFNELIANGSPIEGIIIAAFGDPGLEKLRHNKVVRERGIEVCGIGEASFLEAASGGRRFAVATTTPALEAAIAAAVVRCGLESQFLGSFFTKSDAFEAVRDGERLVQLLAEAVHEAEKAGAEAVIIGGGPLAKAASKLIGLKGPAIVEPVPAAVRLLKARIAVRRY